MLALVVTVSLTAKNSFAASLNITEVNESLNISLTTDEGTAKLENAWAVPFTQSDLSDLFDEFGVSAKEAWYVNLSGDGTVFFQEESVGPFKFDEPDNADTFNFVTALNETTLIFASEATQEVFQAFGFKTLVSNFGPNPFVVENGATIDDNPIDLILSDLAETTPDGGSTIALMGVGVSALVALRRKVRA